MDIFYPLQKIADISTYQLLGIAKESYIAGVINFWIYDMLKISILLICINIFMSITRYYFPMEKTREILSHNKLKGLQYVIAALLGVVTPFCSCSSIPLFIGFLSAGIPLGVTFTFLISSPLINEASLFLFPSIFGMKITLLYNLLGISIAIFSGYVIQKLSLEKYVQPEILSLTGKKQLLARYHGTSIPIKELLLLWKSESLMLTKKVYPYVVLGVTVGAIIHGIVPESFISTLLSKSGVWSIPLAVVIGVPLYANSISIIPIVEAVIQKGVPIGTALAFMTATVTLSIPEALMLKKVLKWQLLVLFFSLTVIGIIIMGYILNSV